MNAVRFLAAAGIVVVFAATGCTAPTNSSDPSVCLVQGEPAQQDIDRKDSPEKPWPHTPGNKVLVNFETGALSARYAGLVDKAAEIWSESPCITAIAVTACQPGSNCVSLEEKAVSRDRGTDGEFTGADSGSYRNGGTITLYTRLLDRASDNGALATIVHEMGHALGLVHRRDKNSVMNASTNDRTNPTPDATDFANLRSIYGTAG